MTEVTDAATWARLPIKDVVFNLYDGPHATPKPAPEGPVFLGIKNITEAGKLDLSEIRHISEKPSEKPHERAKRLTIKRVIAT